MFMGSQRVGHDWVTKLNRTELNWTSLVAQTVECLSTTQETWVQSQGQEDPLEKDMATHSSILTWEIPWTDESGGLQSKKSQRVRYNLATK